MMMTAILLVAVIGKTDVVAMMMMMMIMMMMAARVKAGLIEGDRRREGGTVSLLRTHTGKEQNRTLLTFEQ